MDDEQVMENADPVGEGDAMYEIGERVRIAEDHDIYPGEVGSIVARGKGRGIYEGNIVYDVLVDDTEEAWRFTEHEIEEAEE